MTEAQWDACTDPTPMLEFRRGKASDRRLRLFAVACCRHVWPQLRDERFKAAVELAEQFADGKAARVELRAAWEAAEEAANPFHEEGEDDRVGWACAYAAYPDGSKWSVFAHHYCISGSLDEAVDLRWNLTSTWDTSLSREASRLLREVFGNPFRPVAAHSSWLEWNGGAVVKMAQSAYEERSLPSGELDAARLAVLADALEDAGCGDAAVLAHCRGPGEHVRGCWVVDLLLGKA
jgi:hypothetical protein